jgi:hypothetical protein
MYFEIFLDTIRFDFFLLMKCISFNGYHLIRFTLEYLNKRTFVVPPIFQQQYFPCAHWIMRACFNTNFSKIINLPLVVFVLDFYLFLPISISNLNGSITLCVIIV